MTEFNEETLYSTCIQMYYNYLVDHRVVPTKKAFDEYCVDEEGVPVKWKGAFKDIEALRAAVFEAYPKAKDLVLNSDSFDEDYARRLKEEVKKHRRFVITTAVHNKSVFTPFYKALKSYAKANDAMLLITSCADAKGTRKHYDVNFDPILKDDWIILEDTPLNDNIYVCDIQQSAKIKKPIAALEKFTAEWQASVIVAGCKQLLKNVPTLKGEEPHALMTTGAVTVRDFNNEYFMSQRTSKLATLDYQAGALIVEIDDSGKYYYRQIQATEDGSFSDLRYKYYPNGKIERLYEATLVIGDAHVGAHDMTLIDTIQRAMIDEGFVDTVILHDLCNSASVSHHEENDIVKLIQRAHDGTDTLSDEICQVVRYLNDFTSLGVDVVVVNSNHDEHIERYMRSGAAFRRKDYQNMPEVFDVMAKLCNKEITSPLEYLVKNCKKVKLENPEKVKWLQLDESYVRYGVQLGLHGHLGANGAKGSLKTFENALSNAVVGHSHSGAIQCKIFQVGTTSELDMGYNKGLSSWTRTCCIVHKDGTKQLINFIPQEGGGYEYHV